LISLVLILIQDSFFVLTLEELGCNIIDIKEEFMPRKKKIYSLSREERKVHEFTDKQLRKEYIRLSKSLSVFFVEKKDIKKRMVQDSRYLNR